MPEVHYFLNEVNSLVKEGKLEELNRIFFEIPQAAICKYDGTIIAKDQNNFIFCKKFALTHQQRTQEKLPLEFVENVDVEKIKQDILELTGIEDENVLNFMIYGEMLRD